MENSFVALTALSTVYASGLTLNPFLEEIVKTTVSLGDLCELWEVLGDPWDIWEFLGIFGRSLGSLGSLRSLGSLWRSLEIIES